jgi:hypothetical protein
VATVKLNKQTVTAYGKEQPLQSGMLVDASILLDRRTLFQWVFEPLIPFRGGGRMSFLENIELGFSKKLPSILQTEAAECGLASS